MASLVSKLMERTRPCTKEELRALDGERVNLVYTSVRCLFDERPVINFITAIIGELVASKDYVRYVRDGIEYHYNFNTKGVLYAEKATEKQPDGKKSVGLTKKQFLTVAERLKRSWKELADPESCWDWHQEYMENIRKYGIDAGVLGYSESDA